MATKKAPYGLLGLLLLVLFFIVGFRAGQQVEISNKNIRAFLSTAPTATTLPSMAPVEYKTYSNKACRIAFLYPGYLQLERETTKSGELAYKKELLEFSCDTPITPAASDAAKTFYAGTNPVTRLRTYFYLDRTLLPLLEKTIEYPSK